MISQWLSHLLGRMRGLTSSKSATIISSKSATIIFMSYEGRTVYSSEIKYDIKIIRWEIFSGWNEVEEIRIFYALE